MLKYVGVALLLAAVVYEYLQDTSSGSTATNLTNLDSALPNGFTVSGVIFLAGGGFLAYEAFKKG